MASSDQCFTSFKWARAGEGNEWKNDKIGLNRISMTLQPHRNNITEYGKRIPDGMQQLVDTVVYVDAIAKGFGFW